MANETFCASAWKNGRFDKPNICFGMRIPIRVRDCLFRDKNKKKRKSVKLIISKKRISVSVSNSFWNTCNELRNKAIREWLFKNELVPWTSGKPPKIRVTHQGDGVFMISKSRPQKQK